MAVGPSPVGLPGLSGSSPWPAPAAVCPARPKWLPSSGLRGQFGSLALACPEEFGSLALACPGLYGSQLWPARPFWIQGNIRKMTPLDNFTKKNIF